MTAELHTRPDSSAPNEFGGMVFLLAVLAVLGTLVMVCV